MENFNHIQIRFHQITVCEYSLVSRLGWSIKGTLTLLLDFDPRIFLHVDVAGVVFLSTFPLTGVLTSVGFFLSSFPY